MREKLYGVAKPDERLRMHQGEMTSFLLRCSFMLLLRVSFPAQPAKSDLCCFAVLSFCTEGGAAGYNLS